jgi:tripeptide aminopeptidase
VAAQVEHMVAAISTEAAACGVDVEIDVREAFRGYRHDAGSPLLAIGAEAAGFAGLEPRLLEGGGGSDSNVFNLRGLPALTLGVGFENVHSPQERMSVARLGELSAMAAGVVRAAGTAA